MNLFYAMGGGMGHLYRAWVFIQHRQISQYTIITANPLARKLFDGDNIILLDADRYEESWLEFVRITLPEINPSAFYIDTFPTGITGELSTLKINIPVHYIARRMRWKRYEGLTSGFTLSFSKVYQLEPLEPGHEDFIRNHSNTIEPLHLQYPAGSSHNIPLELIPTRQPIWLVVHAFHKEETETLLQYAKDVAGIEQINPYYVVISDQAIEVSGGMCIPYFPAADWFPLAEKIFTAGGFNAVQQALPYRDKVMFMPFPRKFDDQSWRINYFKSSFIQTP